MYIRTSMNRTKHDVRLVTLAILTQLYQMLHLLTILQPLINKANKQMLDGSVDV